jgi:hypothetical protein
MMNNRRARRLSNLVGYSAARVIYIVIGAVALVVGIIQTLGLTQ